MQQDFKKISYMEAIQQAQSEELIRDNNTILLGEDIAVYGAGGLFDKIEAKRIINTPISENSFTGMAIGAALTGLRPIVDLTISSFVYLASDQIVNQAAKLRYMTGGQITVPIVIRTCLYYNISVAAQHSDRPYTSFINTPGLKIVAPSTPADMKGLLKAAIRDEDPVLVFEDVNLWGNKDYVSVDPDHIVPIGQADIKRAGGDITLVAISGAVPIALVAAKELEAEGISVEVIDPRTLVPLDKQTILDSVAKTGRLVIVDMAHRTGSYASEIAAIASEEAFEYLQKPIQKVATPNVQIPFSPVMEKPLYPNKDSIKAAVKKIIH